MSEHKMDWVERGREYVAAKWVQLTYGWADYDEEDWDE